MINREIVYERNLTGSYMKIPAGINAGLDEKLLLRRKIQGALPVEKAYMDGSGQYWYNISGKQSLDVYCRVKPVGIELIEKLIISICSEMEILEWNLIHTSCLCLDPELIFVTNSNQEFIFTIYPGGAGGVEKEFEQLMEYLLTKIDHKDTRAVRAGYRIYEQTMKEGYSLMDLRREIVDAREKETERPQETVRPLFRTEETGIRTETEEKPETAKKKEKQSEKKVEKEKQKQEVAKPGWFEMLRQKLVEWGILEPASAKEKEPESILPVYPEEVYEEPEPVIRPTICLSSYVGKTRGILLYQGSDQLDDIRIEGNSQRIGYGGEADIHIDRDTISNLHAKIDREGDCYYLEDLNSTNGTFVNDEPLAYKERRKLESNDTVRFADIRYRFV